MDLKVGGDKTKKKYHKLTSISLLIVAVLTHLNKKFWHIKHIKSALLRMAEKCFKVLNLGLGRLINSKLAGALRIIECSVTNRKFEGLIVPENSGGYAGWGYKLIVSCSEAKTREHSPKAQCALRHGGTVSEISEGSWVIFGRDYSFVFYVFPSF